MQHSLEQPGLMPSCTKGCESSTDTVWSHLPLHVPSTVCLQTQRAAKNTQTPRKCVRLGGLQSYAGVLPPWDGRCATKEMSSRGFWQLPALVGSSCPHTALSAGGSSQMQGTVQGKHGRVRTGHPSVSMRKSGGNGL